MRVEVAVAVYPGVDTTEMSYADEDKRVASIEQLRRDAGQQDGVVVAFRVAAPSFKRQADRRDWPA